MRQVRQVDLFLNPIPLCMFCGYPMLPLNHYTCWYSYNRTLENFEPFRVKWHEDLDRTAKFEERFAPQILEAVNKALEERPRLLKKIQETRVESWVEEQNLNGYNLEEVYRKSREMADRRKRHGDRTVPESQSSLIPYLIGGLKMEVV